jgi:hypothetical protein
MAALTVTRGFLPRSQACCQVGFRTGPVSEQFCAKLMQIWTARFSRWLHQMPCIHDASHVRHKLRGTFNRQNQLLARLALNPTASSHSWAQLLR